MKVLSGKSISHFRIDREKNVPVYTFPAIIDTGHGRTSTTLDGEGRRSCSKQVFLGMDRLQNIPIELARFLLYVSLGSLSLSADSP